MTAPPPDYDTATAFLCDENGVLRSVAELRQMEQEGIMLADAQRASDRRRDENRRAAHPVAFSIPQTLYERTTPRGRHQAPTHTERHQILGWPDPEVVAQRIRAVTGGQLSTPAELYAKAERDGAATMTLEELQLATGQFRQWAGDDNNWRPSMLDQLLASGGNDAYMAALWEEGVTLQSVELVAAEYAKRQAALGAKSHGRMRIGHRSPLGHAGSPKALSQGRPFLARMNGGGSLFQTTHPLGIIMGPPPQAPPSGPLPGPPSGPLPVPPTAVVVAPPTGVRSRPVSQQVPELDGTPLTASPVPGSANWPVPSPGQTARVLAEIADALENLQRRNSTHQIEVQEYHTSYDCIVSSLRGFSLRFNSSPRTPQSPQPQPPPRALGPNPFGLRLSHDAQKVVAANPHDQRDPPELPPGSTQTPPWAVWSTTIPYRMRKPTEIGMTFGDYVAAIQSWTDSEEEAWRKQGTPRGGELFYKTPPTWPSPTSPKYPFNMYYEAIRNSVEARAWPQGEIAFAKKEWEDLPAVIQDVYVQRCESLRRHAWLVSMEAGEDPW